MLAGDNSILKRVAQAKENNIIAEENEQIKLAINSSRIDELGGNAKAKGVRSYLKSQGLNTSVYQNEDEIEIEYLDTGHKYIVKANGETVKQEGTDTEEKKVYYKIDGTTLYLSSIKNDESYKEIEDYYYNSDDVKLPEWVGEITTNEAGNTVVPTSPIEKVVVENRIQPKNTGFWFYNCKQLNKIENIGRIDTKDTTNMSSMFENCEGLTSLDVSNFNTSNVTNMESMFFDCRGLTSLDLSSFNTSNVKSMNAMFCVCQGLTSLDIYNFDTSNVKNMGSMFQNCVSLTSLNVSSFNTSNVTNMIQMFFYCRNLTSLDVSNFNTRNVINMMGLFYYCNRLESLDVSNFNTSNVTNMSGMFYGCTSLTSIDVSNFNTSNVTNMGSMFNFCRKLEQLDLSNFDTSKVTNMSWMFNECNALTQLNLAGFNTSNVTDMSYMFNTLKVLETLDISSFDTKNVTNFKRIFNGSISLSKIYVGDNWNTEKNTEESNQVFPRKCNLPNFNKSNDAYRDLKWAYVGGGGYLSKK